MKTDKTTDIDKFTQNRSKLPQMQALDNLIGNFQTKIQNLQQQQAQLSEKTENNNIGFLNKNPEETYKSIEDTLESAQEILSMAKQFALEAPDSETFSSISSIIGSIQSLFREFTSIWQKQLNFQNAVAMENLKLQNKKELEDYKMKLKLEYYNNTAQNSSSGNKTIPFNTKDFINGIIDC